MNPRLLIPACLVLLTSFIYFQGKAQTYALDWVSALEEPVDNEDSFYVTAEDKDHNIWVCGFHRDTLDIDPGPAVQLLTTNGGYDFLIAKFSPAGTLFWAHSFGSAAHDMAYDLGLDDAGNVYVTGNFEGTIDFDPGSATAYVTPSSRDIFVLSLDPSGAYRNVIRLDGEMGDHAAGIGVHLDGSFALTGMVESPMDFDPGAGVTTVTSTYIGTDIFVAKYTAGFALEWVLDVEDLGVFQSGKEVSFDQAGFLYVSGIYRAGDFDPGPGVTSFSIGAGDGGAFMAKYTPTGELVWASAHTGSSAAGHTSSASNHRVSPDGSVIMGGQVHGQMDADPDPDSTRIIQSPDAVYPNAFLAYYEPDGGMRFAHSFGGILIDAIMDIGFRTDGSILAAGIFMDLVDFDPGPGMDNKFAVTSSDMFFSLFSPAGAYLESVQMTETGTASPRSIFLTHENDLVVCGEYSNVCDFDPGAGSAPHDGGVYYNPYLAKYSLPPLATEVERQTGQLRTFPNPVTENLTIRAEGHQGEWLLSLTDLSGHCIRSLTFKLHDAEVMMDVHDLPAGTYLLQAESMSGQQMSAQKVVVMH